MREPFKPGDKVLVRKVLTENHNNQMDKLCGTYVTIHNIPYYGQDSSRGHSYEIVEDKQQNCWQDWVHFDLEAMDCSTIHLSAINLLNIKL
jgi:hypothetical protein